MPTTKLLNRRSHAFGLDNVALPDGRGCREVLDDFGATLEGVTRGFVGALSFHGRADARYALPGA